MSGGVQGNPTRGRAARSCDDCRYSGSPGLHWIDPAEGHTDLSADDLARLEPYSVPCPNAAADDERHRIEELVKLSHQNAWKAAQEVMRDVADTLPEFNANTIRERFDLADVPKTLRGSAVKWAADHGLIESAGRRVMSSEASTRHPVEVWRSKRYGRRAS